MPDEDGVYIKEISMDAGLVLFNHTHTFTHKSVLASGTAKVTCGDVAKVIVGPAVMVIEKGVQHSVESITPLTWLCIHASDESDPEKIDQTLVGEN